MCAQNTERQWMRRALPRPQPVDFSFIGKLPNMQLLKHLNITFSVTSLVEGAREQGAQF